MRNQLLEKERTERLTSLTRKQFSKKKKKTDSFLKLKKIISSKKMSQSVLKKYRSLLKSNCVIFIEVTIDLSIL